MWNIMSKVVLHLYNMLDMYSFIFFYDKYYIMINLYDTYIIEIFKNISRND